MFGIFMYPRLQGLEYRRGFRLGDFFLQWQYQSSIHWAIAYNFRPSKSREIEDTSFHQLNLMENLDSLYTIVCSAKKQKSSPFFLLPALVLHHSAIGARLTTTS
jgi:hypothetical protein